MLGVARFVEKCAPVVRAALRLDDEDDPPRDLDRNAERARRLVGTVFEVELDVALRAQIDAEVAERRLERREHPVARERRVPGHATPRARDIPALHLVEAEPDAAAEEAVTGVLPETLGRIEESAALLCEIVEGVLEAAVQPGVVPRTESLRLPANDIVLAAVERVVLLSCIGPHPLN